MRGLLNYVNPVIDRLKSAANPESDLTRSDGGVDLVLQTVRNSCDDDSPHPPSLRSHHDLLLPLQVGFAHAKHNTLFICVMLRHSKQLLLDEE